MRKAILSFAVATAFIFSTSIAHAKEYIVEMEPEDSVYVFKPNEITIKSGDTIKWLNVQEDSHNVMTESIPKGAEPFNGPMLHKKGDTWSYTFTKSGTYSYHCHPHSALGMEGVIIVDRPSKPEEIQSVGHGGMHHGGMDHSKMGHGGMHHDMDHNKGAIMGEGIVNSIDAKHHKINITHEAIPAISWPSMTMDFVTTSKVDLSELKSGDNVHFTLKLGRDKVYRIIKIKDSDEHGEH